MEVRIGQMGQMLYRDIWPLGLFRDRRRAHVPPPQSCFKQSCPSIAGNIPCAPCERSRKSLSVVLNRPDEQTFMERAKSSIQPNIVVCSAYASLKQFVINRVAPARAAAGIDGFKEASQRAVDAKLTALP
jgi:hypothetical protein